MTAEELLIHELAERAGISVRTIRYYIDEGILPEPKYQGKYSYYTPNFLDRLELIRRLKDSYLPLREIGEIMNSLSDEEVKAKLRESSPSSPKFNTQPSPPRLKPGSRAMEYIDRVMEDQTRYREKGTTDQLQNQLFQDTNIRLQQARQINILPPESDNEVWQRISLAPGVELHLRMPLKPATQRLVERLIDFAKRTFQSKS